MKTRAHEDLRGTRAERADDLPSAGSVTGPASALIPRSDPARPCSPGLARTVRVGSRPARRGSLGVGAARQALALAAFSALAALATPHVSLAATPARTPSRHEPVDDASLRRDLLSSSIFQRELLRREPRTDLTSLHPWLHEVPHQARTTTQEATTGLPRPRAAKRSGASTARGRRASEARPGGGIPILFWSGTPNGQRSQRTSVR
jgi:hypothetical protein